MITKLKPGEIFVFGSNLGGRHGAGAALYARKNFGAEYGVGVGPTGLCYAIPTKDKYLNVLSLAQIEKHVYEFLDYAVMRPQFRFLVTEIGCGLAGYKPKDIRSLFRGVPDNVILPESFK
jgi:hypothetical protein